MVIARTTGGMNIRLHAVTDANGRPSRPCVMAGQVSDDVGAAALLDSLPRQKGITLCADLAWPMLKLSFCRCLLMAVSTLFYSSRRAGPAAIRGGAAWRSFVRWWRPPCPASS